MLNFRNTNLIFAILLVVLISIDILISIPFYYFILVGVLYSAILFYGCYYIQSDFFMKVHCSSPNPAKEIALSFDDGPVEQFTPTVLQILREQKTTACFFCIGKNISKSPELLASVAAEGHLIGNHSYSHHFFFDLFSPKRMFDELALTNKKVEEVTGHTCRLFRPPYGVMTPNLKSAILKGNFSPVGWNVRSMDTVIKDENKLLQRMLKSLSPGAVFLFHDTSAATIAMLPAFIKEVKDRGYSIVPLDKMLALQAYA